MKKISILSLLVILLAGCFRDTIKPDILKDYAPKLVVNSIISAGEPISMEITTSVASIDSGFPTLIRDARVTLSVPGEVDVVPVFNDSTETYTSIQSFDAGTTINVRITHPDFSTVISTLFIPFEIDPLGTLTPDGGIDTGGLPGDLIQVSFADPGNQANYYRLKVSFYNDNLGVWVPFVFPKSDPSLAEYNSFGLDDLSILFNDELFNGQTKTISTVAPSGIVSRNPDEKFRVELTSISKDYFEYYRSLQRAEDAKDITFQGTYNNAVVIHTNLQNGLGIIGTQSGKEIILR
jgi:hypothetical protein